MIMTGSLPLNSVILNQRFIGVSSACNHFSLSVYFVIIYFDNGANLLKIGVVLSKNYPAGTQLNLSFSIMERNKFQGYGMNGNQNRQQQINIELPAEQAEGTYANLAIITHSPAEFIIDFARLLPGTPKTRVYSRILMAPQHAKSLMMALQDNIKKFENQYGEIKLHQSAESGKPFGFQQSKDEE